MTIESRKKWQLPVILSTITLLTTGLLMVSHELTKNQIAAQKQKVKLASVQRLIPANLIDNDLIAEAVDIYEPNALGHRKTEQLYLGKKNGEHVAMAIPVTAQNGYSGDIKLMVGVLMNGSITAVAIIEHQETPGLGDLIDANKSDWLKQFPNKSLQQPAAQQWRVKKDQGSFDQITAATITPRAVVAAIKKALLFHQTWLQQETTNE